MRVRFQVEGIKDHGFIIELVDELVQLHYMTNRVLSVEAKLKYVV